MNQIFFECVIAKFVWGCFKEVLGWERAPVSLLSDFLAHWIPDQCTGFNVKMFHFAIVGWGLWTNRNKMAIEHCFPASSIDIPHKIDFFSQKWGILLPEGNRLKLENHRVRLVDWVRQNISAMRREALGDPF